MKQKTTEDIVADIAVEIFCAIDAIQPTNKLDARIAAELVWEHFNDLPLVFILRSIRAGAMGKFGVGESLTVQIIGFWIYEKRKEVE